MSLSAKAFKWMTRILVSGGAMLFVVVFSTAALLFLNVTAPYQPFAVRSVQIEAKTMTVCPGGAVKVVIDRRFTTDFDQLLLSEAWVTEPSGRPVKTEEGSLPAKQLKETAGFSKVASPLLTNAPDNPGTYSVRVVAQPVGKRYGGFQATGKAIYSSQNTITVTDCEKGSK